MAPIFSAVEARALLERVLALSTTGSCEARLTSRTGGDLRYARNTVTTSGSVADATLQVEAHHERRSGTASTNEFDDASLERVVRRAEALARVSPENPEFVDVLGPQSYLDTTPWSDATAAIQSEFRARAAATGLAAARDRGLIAAGFLQDRATAQAIMTTGGLFAYNRETQVDFSVTARTRAGTGSGWASRRYNDVTQLDVARAAEIANEKAIASAEPRVLDPGEYTVILEPHASRPLIRNLVFQMDARLAEEGRSFLSQPGGGTKLGEQVLGPGITITSDPTDRAVPTSAWAPDGRPLRPTTWVEDGIISGLYYSRFWAAHRGVEAVPRPSHIIMAGGTASLADLIRDTERGVLVTRTWYIRTVDPQSLLYTGLTRDGTFLIEKGSVRHAIKNFRFNESPITMLQNVDAIGRPIRTGNDLIPPLRIATFNFSSLSDAV